MNWRPRKNTLILKGVVKKDIYDKKLEIDQAKAKLQKNKDGDPVEELVLDGYDEVDIIDHDGNYYFDHYKYYIDDRGEEVSSDLIIGDEVYLNARNISIIRDVTDMSAQVTYFYATDGMIIMRRPSPVQL